MNHNKMTFAILVLCALIMSGCQTGGGAGPQSWIDMPLDRTRHDLASIQILVHASSPQGVASFRFAIDGEVFEDVSVRGGRFEVAEVQWTPPDAGIYNLEVVATDLQGVVGGLATSMLFVGDAGPDTSGFSQRMYGVCEGVGGMHLEAHPGMIAPGTCSVLAWEVHAPEDWPVTLDGQRVDPWGEQPFCFELTSAVELQVETPQGVCRKYVIVDVSEDVVLPPSVLDEIRIAFLAEPPQINRGECADLYWEIDMPEPYEVTLDDEFVEPVMAREVCPEATTTYLLTVHTQEGRLERTQTVEVLGEVAGPTPTTGPGATVTQPPAPDTTPPVITNWNVDPADYIFTHGTGETCTPAAFYFSVTVTDSGGVASVTLDWDGHGVRDGPAILNPIGGNLYVHSLGLFVNDGWLDNFSITATDYASNSSSVTPSWNLDVERCH